MSDKDNQNHKEIKLTWVYGPGTTGVYNIHNAAKYEQNLLDALWKDVNQRAAEKEIERELLNTDFVEANQIIARIKQQVNGKK